MTIDRIEEIQKETAYPDSISVQQALLKVWNECKQEQLDVNNPWLSPIESERVWQENHIKKIWVGYPNICPNWQILNGLIRFSCENLNIEVIEP